MTVLLKRIIPLPSNSDSRFPAPVVFAGTHSIHFALWDPIRMLLHIWRTFRTLTWHCVSCSPKTLWQTCAPSSPARRCCCQRSRGQWLLWPREMKSQASQFSSYPGDSLWLFTDIWANTQDPSPDPLHSLRRAVMSKASVLNKSLS